jgi:uncharacterized protein YbaP (TraB family)
MDDNSFKEELHPRADDGKFTSGAGGGKSDPSEKEHNQNIAELEKIVSAQGSKQDKIQRIEVKDAAALLFAELEEPKKKKPKGIDYGFVKKAQDDKWITTKAKGLGDNYEHFKELPAYKARPWALANKLKALDKRLR